MQALILAAGTGSRLGKYTKENTKCMLEINGKPLIDYVLEILHRVGISKLTMVVGHKKENLMRHVGTVYKNVSISYIENPIYYKTNNIYSLFLAKEILAEDDTILLESDLIFEEKILRRLLEDPRPSLAVVDKYQSWMDGTSAVLDDDDNILDFFPKDLFRFQDVDSYYKTVNIYKFSKNFSQYTYIPFLEAYSKAMGDNEYYESVLRVLAVIGKGDLKALRLNGERWYEIDDVHDKANAEIIFAPSAKEKLKLLQSRYGGYWRFPKLKDFCYLVNPYFPSLKMQEEMKAYFYELLSQYPSGQSIQQLLAGKMFGIEADNVVVGNGASEIIRGLGKVLQGSFGLVFPTFNEYPESIGNDRIVRFFPHNDDFGYGIEELSELAMQCDHVLLINPDNPSGNFIGKKDLLELADRFLKSNKTFIVDESFVDFSTNGSQESLIEQDILDRFPNLIVIKSISKSYGVPGVRLGVLATSNQSVLSMIKQEISIWNINSFGEYFLQTIGKYQKEYHSACRKIACIRDSLFESLKEIPYIEPIYSQANYFLIRVVDTFDATQLTELLLEHYDIFIKDLTGKIGLDGEEFVRIAVRNEEDNALLIQALKEIGKKYA